MMASQPMWAFGAGGLDSGAAKTRHRQHFGHQQLSLSSLPHQQLSLSSLPPSPGSLPSMPAGDGGLSESPVMLSPRATTTTPQMDWRGVGGERKRGGVEGHNRAGSVFEVDLDADVKVEELERAGSFGPREGGYKNGTGDREGDNHRESSATELDMMDPDGDSDESSPSPPVSATSHAALLSPLASPQSHLLHHHDDGKRKPGRPRKNPRRQKHERPTVMAGLPAISAHLASQFQFRINPSRTVTVPRQPEEWEPWKPVLEDLYMTQNCILRDVRAVMEKSYNFKATPKMYKTQFSRWNFYKYAPRKQSKDGTDPPPRVLPLPAAGTRKGRARVTASSLDNHETIENVLAPSVFERDQPRAMLAGLSAVRHFLHGYVDAVPPEHRVDVVFRFDDPTYRLFKASIDLFDGHETCAGGSVLRLAFVSAERLIKNPHLKSFADACFLVPHLLIESNKADILGTYLNYLQRFSRMQLGESHPMTQLLAAFVELFPSEPDSILRFIMILSQLNADTVASLPDAAERTRQWARNLYLACQRVSRPIATDSSLVAEVVDQDNDFKRNMGPGSTRTQAQSPVALSHHCRHDHDHAMIRLEAQGVYWAQNLIIKSAESDALASQWLSRDFDDDFATRCEAEMAVLQDRVESGDIPAELAQMMQCLHCGWMNDYYETMKDWSKMAEWGRRGLELAKGEQYIIWSMHLEKVLRAAGSFREAEEIREQRVGNEWLEGVVKKVEGLTLDA